jgi:hypothetical protein
MNFKAAWIASGVVVIGALVSTINSGCGDDDPVKSEVARLARKGEACQTTNDCTPGLACLPNGASGVCVVGVFNVPQTAKECKVVECQTAEDCCDTPPSSCESTRIACEAERDAGTTGGFNCTTYEATCVCKTEARACESGKCKIKCVQDSTCTILGGAGKCLGGTCAACATDTDCRTGGAAADSVCVSGKCQPPCQGDGDCPNFERCLQGQCKEGGCQTDRECIAATKNVESKCGTDGKCVTPCQTDLECGNPKGYSFMSCVGGQCVYMGCDSDKDCRLYLNSCKSTNDSCTSSSQCCSGLCSGGFCANSGSSGSSGSSGITSKQHIKCLDKQTPNTNGAP